MISLDSSRSLAAEQAEASRVEQCGVPAVVAEELDHRHGSGLGPWVAPLVNDRGGDYLPTIPSVHRAVRAVGDHPVGPEEPVRLLHLLRAKRHTRGSFLRCFAAWTSPRSSRGFAGVDLNPEPSRPGPSVAFVCQGATSVRDGREYAAFFPKALSITERFAALRGRRTLCDSFLRWLRPSASLSCARRGSADVSQAPTSPATLPDFTAAQRVAWSRSV